MYIFRFVVPISLKKLKFLIHFTKKNLFFVYYYLNNISNKILTKVILNEIQKIIFLICSTKLVEMKKILHFLIIDRVILNNYRFLNKVSYKYTNKRMSIIKKRSTLCTFFIKVNTNKK